AGSSEKIDPDAKEFGYELEGRLAGLRVLIHAALDVACEATVTGAQVVRRVDWRTPPGGGDAGHAHSGGVGGGGWGEARLWGGRPRLMAGLLDRPCSLRRVSAGAVMRMASR